MEYWEEIDKKLKNKSLTQREGMRKLNAARVNLKHRGIIIKYLERIGDLAVNISKIVKRLAREKRKYLDRKIMDLLIEMGNLVKPELNRALESFKNKDIKLASKLGKSDDMVDEIQKMIFRKLFTSHKCSEEDIKFITNIVLASRYLERIGDQSVNIEQRVLYFLSGDYKVFHNGV